MTTVDRFERTIAEWLHEDADHHQRDHLAEVLERTATTPQRPAWSSLERWLPMDLAARRPMAGLPIGRVLLVAALALGAVTLLVLAAGSQPKKLPAFGIAKNGTELVSLDGDIYSVDRLGGPQQGLVRDGAWDFGAKYSRDGSKFLFLRSAAAPSDTTPLSLEVADANGSNVRDLTGPVAGLDWFDWSPDGTQVVFLSHGPKGDGLIHVVSVSTGTITTLDVGMPASAPMWRPPNGSEIVFRGDGDHPAIYGVRPDGGGLHQISGHVGQDSFDFSDWAISPDGTTVSFVRYLGESTGTQLFLLDVATGAERVLGLPAGGQFERGPAVFSPDGRSVAFDLLQTNSTYTATVMPTDGSSTFRRIGPSQSIPPNGSISLALSWTPDGSAIVAVYGGDTKDAIWWLPVDGSPGSQLVNGPFDSVDVQRVAP
jgi:Tol biopolymer transport system component